MDPLEEALLDDVLNNPDDDTPRLVYADWLLDQDTYESRFRSNFIRKQITWNEGDPSKRDQGGWSDSVCPECKMDTMELCRWHEADVWMRRLTSETLDKRHSAIMYSWLRLTDSYIEAHKTRIGESHFKWERGFVEGVCCDLKLFLNEGHQLVGRHPIRRYRIDKCVVSPHATYFSPMADDAFLPQKGGVRTNDIPISLYVGADDLRKKVFHDANQPSGMVFKRIIECLALNRVRKECNLSPLPITVEDDWQDKLS